MLVPMATVRTAPAPAQQFPIVAPPLPVQNGAQTGSKVRYSFTVNTENTLYVVPIWLRRLCLEILLVHPWYWGCIWSVIFLHFLPLFFAHSDHSDCSHASGPASAASKWSRPSCQRLSCNNGHSSRCGSRISPFPGCTTATCTYQVWNNTWMSWYSLFVKLASELFWAFKKLQPQLLSAMHPND